MTIPDTDELNEIIGSIAPVVDNAVGRGVFQIAASRVVTDCEVVAPLSPLSFSYNGDSKVSFTSLQKRVGRELNCVGHSDTEEMATIVLGLFSLVRRNGGSPVSHLNKLISEITQCKCASYWIYPYPPHPNEQPFSLGSYSIGPLNRTKLIYWCEKVGCDFFHRYPDRFKNRFAITRDLIGVSLLDFTLVKNCLQDQFWAVFAQCCDCYFEAITSKQQKNFIEGFSSAQEIFVAAGAPQISLGGANSIGSTFISIFTEIGRDKSEGYFVPMDIGGKVDFAQAARRFTEKKQELTQLYNFVEVGSSEIHRTLAMYSRFLVRAKDLQADSRVDEALLHYVIALDLLFGEKDSSTQTVANRTAIIVCRPFEESFLTMVKKIKSLYEERSCYVHTGQPAKESSLHLVNRVANEVLNCLLNLQARPECQKSGFIEGWQKHLDFLIAASEAGRPISDTDLIAAGITTGM